MSDVVEEKEKPPEGAIFTAIDHEKVRAEIEERRDERRFKQILLLVLAIPMALGCLAMVLGSLYGWLFLEKEFLEGPVGIFLNGVLEVIKVLR